MAASPPPARELGTLRRRRLSLRNRMMFTFGFGALLLCLLVTTVAYFIAQNSILNESLADLEVRAQGNATVVHELANAGDTSSQVEAVLSEIDGAGGTDASACPRDASVLYMAGEWYPDAPYLFVDRSTNLPRTGDVLPGGTGSVQSIVFASATAAAEQTVDIYPCGPYVLIGYSVPNSAPGESAKYFALFSTVPVAHTLHLLLVALTLAAIVTVVAGMIFGRLATRRVLRPLRSIVAVARAIADGRIDTRIEAEGAGDLTVLADSFNRMVDRLQQRIERDDRFASDVSHELRSPLTTLATALSVIESRRNELPERAAQALDLLSAEVRRFQAMVRDLLEISRLDANSVDLQLNVVEVGELVRNTLANSHAEGIPLEVDPSVGDRQIVADKRRFDRVMTNLIDNAERHGGGAVRVAVEPAGEMVHVVVEDAGPGVEPAERERIFERFARGTIAAGRRGRGGGSGLGLALVAEHVRLHGGRVWVEERGGGGARFVIELPLLARDELGPELAEHETVGER